MSVERRSLHAIGICGVGVSAVARHFIRLGWKVTGCDLSARPIGDLVPTLGHDPSHIKLYAPDLVVYSPAIPEDHPEIAAAKAAGVPVYSYPQALGLLARSLDTIAVSGTHGKSTTTALLALMFEEGGVDPVAIVGAQVPIAGFDMNYRPGEGRTFVVEACEYRRGMLEIHPRSAIVTNIEADHLDYYKDVDDIASAFVEYADKLPSDGYLAYNADDPLTAKLDRSTAAHTISFGFSEEADVRAEEVKEGSDGSRFMLVRDGTRLGELKTPLPGRFNVMNVLAASAMALAYNIPFAAVARAVSRYAGIGRRFETIGRLSGVPILSDYAHHPTALAVLSEAMEARYGKGRSLIVFQPHQIDRTKKLADEFVRTFRSIPHLIVAEIYRVASREHAGEFSVRTLVDRANDGRIEPIGFAGSAEEAAHIAADSSKSYAAVAFVGAGDIDAQARALVASGDGE